MGHINQSCLHDMRGERRQWPLQTYGSGAGGGRQQWPDADTTLGGREDKALQPRAAKGEHKNRTCIYLRGHGRRRRGRRVAKGRGEGDAAAGVEPVGGAARWHFVEAIQEQLLHVNFMTEWPKLADCEG